MIKQGSKRVVRGLESRRKLPLTFGYSDDFPCSLDYSNMEMIDPDLVLVFTQQPNLDQRKMDAFLTEKSR